MNNVEKSYLSGGTEVQHCDGGSLGGLLPSADGANMGWSRAVVAGKVRFGKLAYTCVTGGEELDHNSKLGR